jgi:hypothetical protein
MVQAVSHHSVWEGRCDDTRSVIFLIPSDHWQHYDHSYSWSTFWVTAQITLGLGREYGSDALISVQHFGVRFEPKGVLAMIPKPSNIGQPEQSSEIESEQKGLRVTDPHLQAWFEFYKKVHGEAEDTEDRALESARMNFPGKSVSRERVRALRGSQRRGPKKKVE